MKYVAVAIKLESGHIDLFQPNKTTPFNTFEMARHCQREVSLSQVFWCSGNYSHFHPHLIEASIAVEWKHVQF